MNIKTSWVLAVVTVILGALIPVAVLTFAHPCWGMLELVNDMTVPMKCVWTSRVFIVFGGLFALSGLMQMLVHGKDTHRYLGVMQIALAVAVYIISTSLGIGVCTKPMECHLMATVVRVIDVAILLMGAAYVLLPCREGVFELSPGSVRYQIERTYM
ncbi:MAG: DUF4418 family protein [Candidatus Saccharibacteria bacterium]